MTILKNEKGNAAIFMIWLLSIVAVLFLILVNIGKIFVTAQNSSNAAEQAAIAGTAIIIDQTKKAIAEYDSILINPDDPLHHGLKSIGTLVAEKRQEYGAAGYSSDQAYIMALNDVLPEEITAHDLLKEKLKERISSSGLLLRNKVTSIINNNDGSTDEYGDIEVVLSETDWRIEVKAKTKFESISDGDLISFFQEKIPGEGYGPSLIYLEQVYEVE